MDPTDHHFTLDAWTLVIVVFQTMPTVHLAQLGSGIVIRVAKAHFRLIMDLGFDHER